MDKPTAVPPTLNTDDVHGLIAFGRAMFRGLAVAAALAGFMVLVGLLIVFVWR